MNTGTDPNSDSVDEESGTSVTISLNRLQFRVQGPAVTGATIRSLPTPPIGADFDLYRIDTHGTDLLIRDDEVLDVEDGDAFFAVPQSILAGSSTQACGTN